MEFIVPLRIQTVPSGRTRLDHSHIVEIALRDQPGAPSELLRLLMETLRQLRENMASAQIVNAVNRIQPQSINVILSQPI